MFQRRSLLNEWRHTLPALFRSLAVKVIAIGLCCAAAGVVQAQGAADKDAPATAQRAQASELTPEQKIAQLEKQLTQLKSEVARLRAELAKLEKYKQIDYTRDLMVKEEDRIRSLQSELNDITAKETALNKRLDEIEREQQPDRIQRSMAGVGLTRPEEEREAIMKRLVNEKRQIQTQLETLRSSRARIPNLIANAEASISRLKQRLAELSRMRTDS
jgi:DNA repair exonuclease SbcCD ATPase subunit